MSDFDEFEKELASLINRHSMENGSGTPDFIVAAYLTHCLKSWNAMVRSRESWYGREQDQFGMPVPKAVDTQEDSKIVAFKVITADFGTNVKTVGLLDHSTDEVAWMNHWLMKRDAMPRPFSMNVTEFDGFGTPNLFSAMTYLVQSGKVNRDV
ncbi:hypothetical protein HWB51_gp079 [Mycobacterium phage Cuke]|uniref:Uncharacterized protein n=1 Tax=Mycobacterium phage Cuke TaxID=2079417 RepID=A0A2L1IX87_9CAUD|nr:hypothetical protein HWB51_gp079 [Mycobacterium phage Cuke]AVD99733.1 hypothetical protein SEA_CUKE_117 [Mycobacterium phage Cuke]